MTDDVFTTEDLEKSAHYGSLGPAYFAARRAAESLMGENPSPEPLKKVADKMADELKTAVYEYFEAHLLSDLESNLQHHIERMVDATVEALLNGNEWAMKRYPLAPYGRGEEIRAAVAKHGGDELQQKRIADLEKEVARLRESLEWARR
jgi:hypothetical protein